MTAREWRCPNCSAPMELHAEEGRFRCSYCGTALTVGDVQELVRRARREEDTRRAGEAAPGSIQLPPAGTEPAGTAAQEKRNPVARFFGALGNLARWAVGIFCGFWVLVMGIAGIGVALSEDEPMTWLAVLFLVAPATLMLAVLIKTRKKKGKGR